MNVAVIFLSCLMAAALEREPAFAAGRIAVVPLCASSSIPQRANPLGMRQSGTVLSGSFGQPAVVSPERPFMERNPVPAVTAVPFVSGSVSGSFVSPPLSPYERTHPRPSAMNPTPPPPGRPVPSGSPDPLSPNVYYDAPGPVIGVGSFRVPCQRTIFVIPKRIVQPFAMAAAVLTVGDKTYLERRMTTI